MQRFVQHHGRRYGSVSGITDMDQLHKGTDYFVAHNARARVTDTLLLSKYTSGAGRLVDGPNRTKLHVMSGKGLGEALTRVTE